MSSHSTTARTAWRRVIHQFAIESLSRGRETAIAYVLPAADFTIDDIHDAHSPDELPAEAVILQDLSHLNIEPRDDALAWSVDPETGEITGEPRLRPQVAGEAKALADHLLAEAWSQALKRRRRGAAWSGAE
jgi:hypothetical protein